MAMGVEDDLPGAIIISVTGHDDEAECIGLMSTGGSNFVRIRRDPGETLETLDGRAERYGTPGAHPEAIHCWMRVYSGEEEDEPDGRVALFNAAQDALPKPGKG